MGSDLIFYQFSRSKVEHVDFRHFLDLYDPDRLPTGRRLREMMNCFVFCVEGWDGDPREIHTIPDIRRFYSAFHDAWPYWLYFCNLDVDTMRAMVACCLSSVNTMQVDGKPQVAVTLDPMALLNILKRDFMPMNLMCERAELPERGIYDRSKAVFEYFGLPFDSEPPPLESIPASSVAPQPGGKAPTSIVMMMTIPEILKELELYTGRFPMEAMKAAIEQREAITPELLRVLETVAEDPAGFAKRQDYMLHLFALFLLAQFREKRAYPLVVKMFSGPGEIAFDLAGDTVAQTLSRVSASVYDGNPEPLRRLVENEAANEYVRSAAIDAFLVLEHTGQMTRDEVVGYFRSLFRGKIQREHSYVWDGLVCAVADLPAPELLEEVRQAYAEGLVDSMVADLPGIERDLVAPMAWRRGRFNLITSAIDEIERWSCFHHEDTGPERVPEAHATLPPQPSPPPPAPADYVPPRPFISQPKVGRNDPCPCGSGKKYKKCCGKV